MRHVVPGGEAVFSYCHVGMKGQGENPGGWVDLRRNSRPTVSTNQRAHCGEPRFIGLAINLSKEEVPMVSKVFLFDSLFLTTSAANSSPSSSPRLHAGPRHCSTKVQSLHLYKCVEIKGSDWFLDRLPLSRLYRHLSIRQRKQMTVIYSPGMYGCKDWNHK